MAQTPKTEGTETKAKRKRTPSAARPVFVMFQVLDENGNPVKFDKSRIKVVGFEKSADAVLAVTEDSDLEHVIFVRGMLPVAIRQDANKA